MVDDHPSNRALVKETLEEADYRVVLAADGLEALEVFTREQPDAVILDVRMPRLDGFATCERLRLLPGGADVPVLFFTALRDVDTFDNAMRHGAVDFLTKPALPSEILVRVGAALALRRAHAQRDDLFEAMRHQRDVLMRTVLVNERLAAFLVHDLKNPVTGMQLAAELIARDPGVPERSRDIAQRIRNQAQDLSRMIMGLLDISKSDEGRLVIARATTEAAALVRDALEAQAIRAEAAGVTLRADVDALVLAVDVNLIRRVLENLVENAIRHAPEGSEIRVSARRQADTVVLAVADRGRGVPEPMRERIFDRFVQLDEEVNASRGGRGLGLAFCKLVVEAHGGSISIEDGAPGAVFSVRLPDVL
ncbi:MAG: hybrid sensor histidine kinase/response regulator [Myxococcota bacterium]